MMRTLRTQSGFTMIEVMVTLLILMLGLLGLAGMMVQSQRAEVESYQRVQALILVQDMVGRINANRQVASCYAITTSADGTPYVGTDATIGVASPITCAAGSTEQNALAVQDLKDWNELLLGATETTGSGGNTTKTGGIISARGCVSVDATTTPVTYQVSVAWQGIGSTKEPPATWPCAKGNYGDDKQRRVVSATVRIAKLS